MEFEAVGLLRPTHRFKINVAVKQIDLSGVPFRRTDGLSERLWGIRRYPRLELDYYLLRAINFGPIN